MPDRGLDMSTPDIRNGKVLPTTVADSAKAPDGSPQPAKQRLNASQSSGRIPSVIVGLVIAAVAGLSIWYLVRPEPLLVQGEVDATRLDIAARVDGRVADIPVVRGQNVAAGAVLVRIDNPETLAKHEQAMAAKVVAEAQLANINVGTRAEVIAARKAALERAQASVVLAQEDLRPRQPAGRARQCAAGAPRPGDRCPARKRARRGSGQIGLRAGGQRLHARGA